MPTFVVCSPSHVCDPQLAIAAHRAGELGLLDLGYVDHSDHRRSALRRLAADGRRFSGSWGVRWDLLNNPARTPRVLADLRECPWPYLVLAGVATDAVALDGVLAEARKLAEQVWLEVYDVEQAKLAADVGFDGLIIRGHEGGGLVSADSSFLLLQHLAKLGDRISIPYWLQGGIGPDTAAAAITGGAAGVVLAEQLWCAAEAPFDAGEKAAWKNFDGSETAPLEIAGRYFRFLCRTDRGILRSLEQTIAAGGDAFAALAAQLQSSSGATDAVSSIVPLGQDIALAAKLAGRGLTVADILNTIRKQIDANLQTLRSKQPFTVGGPLAEKLGTKYPILQGPMTRVSDTAEFCAAVAENGALPFLALAVMSGNESRTLLRATKEKLGRRPWGVGVLGFIPGEVREAQDAAIAEVVPKYAIIAGGRPSQAARFEKLGISTFLHVPSPGLLETFIADGARKFIFEGRECGGHVGPRPSFILWQQQIDVLLAAKIDDPSAFQIIFAGGIHDGFSAAVVAALTARLVERGMNVGVLLGTGYLFTAEAVSCGAITEEFQRQAVACRETVLLESGVGHATRCARTEFAEGFNAYKNELILVGKSSDEIRLELELFNIGRLRIASKGRTRSGDSGTGERGSLIEVDVAEQRRTGMYMIGQVAALRDRVVPMSELHAELVSGCTAHLAKFTNRSLQYSPKISATTKVAATPDEPIAIVGMAGMFPKAGDIGRFWANIFNRIDAVTEVSPERWCPNVNFDSDRMARDTVYSKWGGFLDEVRFDPFKWKIPPASLASIEPVQLLSLEVAWAAFRDAGFDHRPFPRDRTSVIFGIAGPHDVGLEYSFRTMAPHFLSKMPELSSETVESLLKSLRSELVEWTEDSFPGFLSNVVAGRIANRLDLGGTNFVVDAACAASLAALHTGIAQLRLGWSDVVLLGTADGSNNLFTFQSFSKTHALSPRGRSRPFDDSADGIAIGEAIAALVLKRLSDAERDGDRIYAVIRGIGSSSDGNNRSLTAPHAPAQVQAIRRAYADAQVDAGTISLVEAHGTGTAVGDRSEIQALVSAFSESTSVRQAVAVGSIKSMIGHTKTAAGVVGVVKAALALRHRVLPPTIGVDVPNKLVDFSRSPFFVNTEVRPWFQEYGDHPRRAGVSAFGFGGTNFHVVMEEYVRGNAVPKAEDLTPRPVEVFCWRRESRADLVRDLHRLIQLVSAGAPENLTLFGAACWAAERRRKPVAAPCRLAIIASTGSDLSAKLARAVEKLESGDSFSDPTGIYYSCDKPLEAAEVCFLYPGQGSQAVGMLRDLVAVSPWTLDLFARWNKLLAHHLDAPLTRYIYPPPTFTEQEAAECKQALVDTRVAQPALGAVEVFATQLLAKFGLRPAFTAGHSYGEYVALFAADCITSDDLLAVSAVRGRVSAEAASVSPGAMAAVQLGADALQPILDELKLSVVIANRNSPQQAVVAGTVAEIEAALEKLKERGLRATRLAVSAPFHTPALAAGVNALASQLATLSFREPTCAIYSNTTGERYPAEPTAIRALLQRHLIEPVRFDRQIERMFADGARLFIEVGPGRALTGLVGQILHDKRHITVCLDSNGRDGVTQLAHLLGTTIALGLPVALDAWFSGRADADRSPQEILRDEAAAREVKPTDWFIGPAAMRPAKPLPKADKNEPQPKSAEPTVRRPSTTVAPAATPKPSVVTSNVAAAETQKPVAKVAPAAAAHEAPLNRISEPVHETPPAPNRLAMAPPSHPSPPTQSTPRTIPTMTSPASQHESNAMEHTNQNAIAPGAAELNGHGLARPSPAADCQSVLSQWISMQNNQILLNERFLRLQERLMFGDTGAAHQSFDVPMQRVAQLPAPVEARPAAAPQPNVMLAPAAQSTPSPASNGSAVRMTPLAVSRGPIALPARATEPQAESRLLRSAAAPAQTRPATIGVGPDRSVSKASPTPQQSVAATNGNAVAAVAATDGPPSTEAFCDDLLRVVSERTGYPVDMLDKDVPLEAGLGIDSIKTVEVFSKLKPYHAYFQRPDQDEEEVLKVFTRLKTLRDIVNLYDEQRQAHLAGNFSTKAIANAPVVAPAAAADRSSVKRFELQAVEAVGSGEEKKKGLSTTS